MLDPLAILAASLLHTADGERFLLLDHHLHATPVHLLSIDSRRLRVRAGDDEIEQPLERVVALLPSYPHPPPEFTSYADLIDGWRIPGQLLPELATDEALFIRTRLADEVRIELDRVASIVLSPRFADPHPLPPQRDEVRLLNGDVLTGFVQRIGRTVEVETSTGTLAPAISDVGRIALANPRETPSGCGVWLADGSILSTPSIEVIDGQAVIRPMIAHGSVISIPAATVLAVVFDTARLVPLESLHVTDFAPDPSRRWSEPPGVLPHPTPGIGVIEIPGPMRITWALPEHAERVAGVLTLPEPARTWGDCEVSLHAAGRELWRTRLHPDTPSADFSQELPDGAAHLSLMVEPGRFGPIQDRVTISRAFVLLTP